MNSWWDYIRHKIDVSKELDADLNFPTIHLMPHWVEQIGRYGAFQQLSAETPEQAQKTNLKDGWNTSNHNLNYLPQAINLQRCILCFEVREQNLQALAKHRENSAAACKDLSSGTDLATPLSPKSYAKPKFIGPQ
jgi:hypothetical protein